MAFSPPVLSYLVKKGLQKGGHGHPRTPLATPLQSLGTQITMLICTIAGGRTKGANEYSFVFVHQHGGYDVK